jgi:D-serine deaminase-like pyridoxal phosphate-dependent protein
VDRELPVGSRVRLIPYHSCLTAACWDQLVVVEGEEVVDRWVIHRQR